MTKDTLLILSGGMDSVTALRLWASRIAVAITFNYGSKHNMQEAIRAEENCKELGIEWISIDMEEPFKNLESALLDPNKEIPEGHYAADNMAATVVPFRNGIMLSLATGIAESRGLKRVMLASHKGDFAQYPDCTPEFNKGFNDAMRHGTSNHISLHTPFEKWTKEQIATRGDQIGIKWSNTYSCYKGGDIHCGKCGTCVERIWALRGLNDDTEYEDSVYAIEVLKKSGEWDVPREALPGKKEA